MITCDKISFPGNGMTQLISRSLCYGGHCHHCVHLGLQFPPKVHPQQVVRLLREILALIGEPGATLAVRVAC